MMEDFAAGAGYLDTASVGLPPRATVQAMRDALTAWSEGRARPPEFDPIVAEARATFARLVHARTEDVCIGATASGLAAFVATALPDGAEVVAVRGDFTSVLFPFLAQEERGVRVRLVALEELPGAIGAGTDLVAFSAVQSADGAVAELDAVVEAAAAHGARTYLDATQACGWLPLDARRFDFLACATYKWLLAPRGCAFMAVRPGRLDDLRPNAAGWYAGEDPWTSIYDGPLRLASSARRLDTSPAWLCWVGAVPSLRLLESLGVEAVHAHDVGLADLLRTRLGMEPGGSAIVAIDRPGAAERLAAAGLRASTRAGAARLSFHLYNTPDDVDRAVAALG